MDEGKEVKKEEEAPVGSLNSSVGKIGCWCRPAVYRVSRVSFDVAMAKRGNVQPNRRSTRMNKDVEREKDARDAVV